MAEEKKGLSYEELVERFRQKVASIPEECHKAIMLWMLAKEVQKARIAAENNLRQVMETGKKVFYAGSEIPDEIKSVMARGDQKYFDSLRKQESSFIRACDKAFKETRWFNEVAVPAAEGEGMGPMMAGEFLWTIGSAHRFPSFGRLVRYAGLDVQNGKAPKRQKGQRVTWNPQLRTALYKLSENWNRNPEGIWRARWDGWKVWYAENRPHILDEKGGKGHIHDMARRKVQREFLRNLYGLWWEYEEETSYRGGD